MKNGKCFYFCPLSRNKNLSFLSVLSVFAVNLQALLSTIFKKRVRQKTQEMLKDMAEGVRNYEHEDFKRIEDEVLADLLIKLDEVKSQKELSEIKTQLRTSIAGKQQKSQAPTPPVPSSPV